LTIFEVMTEHETAVANDARAVQGTLRELAPLAEAKPAPREPERTVEAAPVIAALSLEEEPKAFPAPPKRRLIASRPDSLGNVAAIMADILEPGRGKVEFEEAYKGYAKECQRQGRAPVSIDDFADAIDRFCKRLNIGIEADKKGHVYILKARLKKVEKNDVATLH